MEFYHLGRLGNCKQVMALWIMARGTEVVARLLNQISVMFEESNKKHAYISTVLQQTAIRKLRLDQYLSTYAYR